MSADAAGAAGRFSLEFVTMLYSATLAMSGFFQNNLLLRKACNSTVPFGLCTDGEAHAQHVVSVIYSWKACIQYVVPVVLIVLSGQWRYSAQRVCSAGRTFADFSLVFFFFARPTVGGPRRRPIRPSWCRYLPKQRTGRSDFAASRRRCAGDRPFARRM